MWYSYVRMKFIFYIDIASKRQTYKNCNITTIKIIILLRPLWTQNSQNAYIYIYFYFLLWTYSWRVLSVHNRRIINKNICSCLYTYYHLLAQTSWKHFLPRTLFFTLLTCFLFYPPWQVDTCCLFPSFDGVGFPFKVRRFLYSQGL